MTRLNKSIRDSILANAIKASGYTARNEKLISRRAKLADDVRLFSIGGTDKELELDDQFTKVKKQLKKLGDSFFSYTEYVAPRRCHYIECNFAGRAFQLYFNGEITNSREVKSVYKDYVSPHSRVAITADNKLNDEFDSIEAEARVIKDLLNQVRAEVVAMVNSVTTIKKLLEIWPEAKDLLPSKEKVQSTALVANVDKLNAMLNLPKD